MNTVSLILKIAAAIAVVAGLIFVAVAYGDKILSWCKKLMGRKPCGECVCDDLDYVDDIDTEDTDAVVASDKDFEG